MNLLLSTQGRIGRGQFWLGFIILLVITIPLSFILLGDEVANGGTNSWMSLIISIIMLYPAICLGVKRLRDRGRNNLPIWLVAYFAPGVLVNFAQTFGIGFETQNFGGIEMSSPTTLGSVLMGAAFIAFIVSIIDLGFLKGTQAE